MGKLLVLLMLAVLPPVLAEESPSNEQPADMKPLQVAVPCEVKAEVLEAKVAALEARLQSLTAYVELLKTEEGLQYAFLEGRGNALLPALQGALLKAIEACGEGQTFDLDLLQCKKKPDSPESPAASAP
jgi:hypothetical protein